jgi:hypothetical protein
MTRGYHRRWARRLNWRMGPQSRVAAPCNGQLPMSLPPALCSGTATSKRTDLLANSDPFRVG